MLWEVQITLMSFSLFYSYQTNSETYFPFWGGGSFDSIFDFHWGKATMKKKKNYEKNIFQSVLIAIICSYEAFWQFLWLKIHRTYQHSSDFWQPSDFPELVHNYNNCVWSNSFLKVRWIPAQAAPLADSLEGKVEEKKVHPVFFMKNVVLVQDFIHVYPLPLYRWEKICLVLHVLPSMEWQRGFW